MKYENTTGRDTSEFKFLQQITVNFFCLRLATREGKIEGQGKSVKMVCNFYDLLYLEILMGCSGVKFHYSNTCFVPLLPARTERKIFNCSFF